MKKLFIILTMMVLLWGINLSGALAQVGVDLTFRVYEDPNDTLGADSNFIQIQIATDITFSNLIEESGWLFYNPIDTLYTYTGTFPDDIPSVIYWWRGRAMAEGEISDWGNAFWFTLVIQMLPQAPKPISPENGSLIVR